ncbi:hypothetical protein E1B28_010906 [Marasmius oreades]|uniref:Uncharacterized protein n=1 Tax=Marasmius oreades TaxID=181124 RepID=A0A9P7RT11_9AGAR|nr:uncharacterized protein E1B28_010906 [Marasmius oreades]KAG7089204.1 hypothetical protein E1B28_010906 [Marasmius oreades]
MFLGKRSSGILDGDVSIFIRSAFSFFIIILVCVVIQAFYAFTILVRRSQVNLTQLPFIFILSTSLTLIVVYIMQIVSFSSFYDVSAAQISTAISPGPGVVVIVIQFFQRLADFLILSSLISILDYRRMLFKRDTLFMLFRTRRKRIFDVLTMSLMLLAILAVTALAARHIGTARSGVVTKSGPAVDALSTLRGLENTYVIIYVAVSLNMVITTLYQWMQIIKVESFRDETVLVLLRFASPVVILRAGFEISIAIISSAKGFNPPFDASVFVFVVTLVDGLSYVTITVVVLCLDGKMAEGIRQLPEVLSI